MAKDIVVPENQIGIYVDETYFHQKSGLLQVGLPFPQDCAVGLAEEIRELRTRMRIQQKVFKADSIEPRNVRTYSEFLRRIINVLGIVGDGSQLRAVISMEAEQVYQGRTHRIELMTIEKTFARLGIPHAPVAKQFARQVVWLQSHFDHLCRSPVQNAFTLLVDGKYKDVFECRSTKLTRSALLGRDVPYEPWKVLTTMLGWLIADSRGGRWKPQFTEFHFENDKESLCLQAADLLSNLFYNGLLFDKGVRTEIVQLKNEILREVFLGPFHPRVLDVLEVITARDGQKVLFVKDKELSGRMTLLPQTRTIVKIA